MRVLQFYIGDEPNIQFESSAESDVIRTMLESVPDETETRSILLDSGADASVFPSSMAELGCLSVSAQSVLRDAQGNTIPLHGMWMLKFMSWTCVDVQFQSKRLWL